MSTNSEFKSECENLLQVFKTLLVMSFINAKLDTMFSQILKVKSN